MKFCLKWLVLAIATVATVFLLTACTMRTTVTCSPPTIQNTVTDLSINLYLDGTPSMEGFVDKANSQYIRWIDRLQTTLQNDPVGLDGKPHKVRSLNYFRLGSQSGGKTRQPLTEDDYGDAQTNAFYNGQTLRFPLLNVSEIDTAIVPPKEPNGLTVVVTDLYQAKDDIGKVVSKIKTYLTSQNLNYAIGILGIKSEFNGRVYTEGRRNLGDFLYPSNGQGQAPRPFYILCIGQIDEINFYFKELLDGQPGVGETINAVVYSPYRLFEQPFALAPLSSSGLPTALKLEPKQPQPKLQIPGLSTKFGNLVVTLDGAAKIQGLKMVNKSPEFGLVSTANWAPIQYVPELDASNALQVKVIPQSFDRSKKQFVENTQEPLLKETLRLDNWKQSGKTLNFVTQFLPQNIRGNGIYFFQAEVSVKPGVNLFSNQSDKAWWKDWSSDASSNDGSKTHNLAKFMEALQKTAVGVMQQNPPMVGRFCYLVQKG